LKIISFPGFRKARFERLLEPHFEQLYRLAFRFTAHRDEAEDLVQELLVRLYPKRERLAEIEDLRPWLARTLYNLYVDTYRAKRRSPTDLRDDEAGEHLDRLTDHSADPLESEARRQDLQLLDEALHRLSEAHRDLLILHDMEGYSLPELKEILELPLGTLKSRLHRAREAMRQLLSREPFDAIRRVNQ
jgi:RNA polymerase sigma factor (sigma-70 family)